MLSQHHFQMLDEQALAEKLESTRHILSLSAARDELEDQEPQLRALLGAHQDLSAEIHHADGTVLFSDSKASRIPERFEQASSGAVWDWQIDSQNFRGLPQLAIAGAGAGNSHVDAGCHQPCPLFQDAAMVVRHWLGHQRSG
jgi:two-component system heavy metal sensor histidine kinase CusS